MSAEFPGANQEKIKPDVVNTLLEYKKLGEKFENPPQIILVICPLVVGDEEGKVGVRDISISAAMQCYAAGVSTLKPRLEDRQQAIADRTAEAGHHTTRMHANFTFHINVTRDLAERVLHANPFYNSEQQSQRYVEAKDGNYEVAAGLTPEQRDLYITSAEYMNKAYFNLLTSLHESVEQRVQNMYPGAGWNYEKTAKRLNSKVDKICQEVARYVLPIAQKTTMYHTLSELQIMRLFRASQFENFSDEAKYTIATMVEEIAEVDPSILLELDKPLPPYEHPHFSETRTEQKQEFDEQLNNKNSIILGTTGNLRNVLAFAVRNITGATEKDLPDDEAIKLLISPVNNVLLADVYETGMLDPFTECLRQVSITAATKLSHTAESQRQRQRRTPGAVPTVDDIYDGTADYMTPLVIRENIELRAKYDEIMTNIYANVEKCLQAGVPREVALKLLPNAQTIRIVETGDMFDWLHRFKQRLCFLAQEEFCFISIEQVEMLTEEFPEFAELFLAPCAVAEAAGTGRCPEGTGWCGKPVWKWKIDKYKKERLI
ncbi:MAG TPA: FAD-dependent thymidylate synthase [Patescibacteria group bacterium]|nr:FAD-dependent thymidylate synthase [Patescibacteria group bacterium]